MTLPCRAGCGACCVAPSITTPFRGMPHGKPAGERCVHLTPANLCALFGHPDRPQFCSDLKPSPSMCRDTDSNALRILTRLELDTRPDR
ncbi:MAG: YkgJ family cysteine cluster protein [Planctomycetes bacterium]|nr:YkgJ family cysteine cluster protein [Planctomycetota bacterium]